MSRETETVHPIIAQAHEWRIRQLEGRAAQLGLASNGTNKHNVKREFSITERLRRYHFDANGQRRKHRRKMKTREARAREQ